MTNDDYIALAKKVLSEWTFVSTTSKLAQESYDILYSRVAAALKALHQQERQDWLDCGEYSSTELGERSTLKGWNLGKLMRRYRAVTTESITTPASYPEHDKLRRIQDKSQAISDFLDWAKEKRIILSEYISEDLFPTLMSKDNLLAEHFGIDLKKLEQEKRAMLDKLRTSHT